MMMYIPPFEITPFILQKTQEIQRFLGTLEGEYAIYVPLKLRREHQIKTIQASLSIEGNTLSLDQMTALLNGQHVLGPSKDIQEAENALALYQQIFALDPLKEDDLLLSHSILMKNLMEKPGFYRTGSVRIFKGNELHHLAPKADRVPFLMSDLFTFVQQNKEISWLLKACIFHYEFEFIHPFLDGNGRMGRLWQQLLLMKEHEIFGYMPIEVLIKSHQESYYQALSTSDQEGDGTHFIEFSLNLILESLHIYAHQGNNSPKNVFERLEYAHEKLKNNIFSRKEYQNIHPSISLPTASRDLFVGTQKNLIKRQGEKNKTRYQFV